MPEPVSRRALWFQKLSDEVVRGITERIESGALKPGAAIGTRDDLAAEFVTSKSVVDRAVDVLRDEGMIGEDDGPVLKVAEVPAPISAFALPARLGERLEDVIQILELRLGVETEAAALAAVRQSEADLQAIRDAAAAYEAAAAGKAGAAQADYRFHRAIAAASGNPYLLDILEHLGPLLIPRMRIAMPTASGADASLGRSIEEHAAIVEAIGAGDADRARSAMRAHLARTIEMLRGLHQAPEAEA